MKNGYEKTRLRLVEEQLVPRGIHDSTVLHAMATVPRHLFVEEALRPQAYGDFPLPIGEGQTISQPYIVALMTQSLALKKDDRVLEIGTGCGYQTAILATLCRQVYTVERIKSLLAKARRNFDLLQLFNILSKADDGTSGWAKHAPFDAIIVTAGGPKIPQPLVEQLADPGLMVMPVGESDAQALTVLQKNNGKLSRQIMENVRFVKLVGAHGWQAK
ncbi:MAG: protein-L-isoaspartate(D-aspartate) O-methyltransferase [Desulfobulbaceae bacterium]|nr:MAG: protein-L-isoaspartate(D-aspartate) O-methyltransferase [Desulfobulbaceae bacterium]